MCLPSCGSGVRTLPGALSWPFAPRRVTDVSNRTTRRPYVSPYHLAFVYTGLGEQEQGLDLIEQACDERTGAAYSITGLVPARAPVLAPQIHGMAQNEEPR